MNPKTRTEQEKYHKGGYEGPPAGGWEETTSVAIGRVVEDDS